MELFAHDDQKKNTSSSSSANGPLWYISHCLTPGPGPRPGPGPGLGIMACMILCRNVFILHRDWNRGDHRGKTQMGAIPIFQVLKMFPVMNTSVLPCPGPSAV